MSQRKSTNYGISLSSSSVSVGPRCESRWRAQCVTDVVRCATVVSPLLRLLLRQRIRQTQHQSSPVSIQTQSLALASSQSWLPLLRPSILLAASDCVWMETGLQGPHPRTITTTTTTQPSAIALVIIQTINISSHQLTSWQ